MDHNQNTRSISRLNDFFNPHVVTSCLWDSIWVLVLIAGLPCTLDKEWKNFVGLGFLVFWIVLIHDCLEGIDLSTLNWPSVIDMIYNTWSFASLSFVLSLNCTFFPGQQSSPMRWQIPSNHIPKNKDYKWHWFVSEFLVSLVPPIDEKNKQYWLLLFYRLIVDHTKNYLGIHWRKNTSFQHSNQFMDSLASATKHPTLNQPDEEVTLQWDYILYNNYQSQLGRLLHDLSTKSFHHYLVQERYNEVHNVAKPSILL